ncbi:hypothetical protein ACSW8S_19835 (plasmid) [Clostridium perfringens]
MSLGQKANNLKVNLNSVNEICSKLNLIDKLDENDLDELFKKDIYFLDKIYIKLFKIRAKRDYEIYMIRQIEECLFNVLLKNREDKILENLDVYRKEIVLNKGGMVLFLLKYCGRKVFNMCDKYINVLNELGLEEAKYKKFIFYYCTIMFSEIDDKRNFLNKLYLTREEKNNLIYLIKDKSRYKINAPIGLNLVKVSLIAENYIKISETNVYDEEVLKGLMHYKKKILYMYLEFGCSKQLNKMLKEKVRAFREENVTMDDIDNANKYGFSCKSIQNTIFIKSKIDTWYVTVDKLREEAVLYHGNDATIDEYHYQRKFQHSNLNWIFKYINKHDVRTLRGSQRKFYI